MNLVEPHSRSSNLINAKDCFIIVIDVQPAFMRGLSKEEQSIFVQKYQHLIRLSHVLKIPLIITAEDIQKNGSIPMPLQKLLVEEVQVLDKFIYICWGQKNIQEMIKNTRKTVAVVCGFETDVCVLQTSIDLIDEYRVVILTDITFSRNNKEHEIGLKRIERAGAISSSLKSWQEEITAGVRTRIHQILVETGLADI